jgi:hypothetical protein
VRHAHRGVEEVTVLKDRTELHAKRACRGSSDPRNDHGQKIEYAFDQFANAGVQKFGGLTLR